MSRRRWLMLLATAVVTLAGIWPWPLHPKTTWLGLYFDQCLYIWGWDLQARSILAGTWPIWTDNNFYPFGIDLVAHQNTGWVWGILAIPFVSHLAAYLTALECLSIGGAVLTTTLFIRQVGGTPLVGMLVGTLYALGPVRDAVIRSHAQGAMAAALAPVALWAVVRLARAPGWRTAMGATLMLWLVMSTNPYFGIVTASAASGALVAYPSRRFFAWVAALAVGHLGLALMLAKTWDPVPMGAFWNIANADVGDLVGAFAPLILPALLGFRAWPWFGGVLLSTALAIGGCIRWGGVVYANVPFPWVWLAQHSTIWGVLDIPRYLVLGVWLGMMAPIAAASRQYPRATIASVVVSGVGSLWFLLPPMIVSPVTPTPPAYQRLATLPPGVLLEIPGGLVDSKTEGFGATNSSITGGYKLCLQVEHQHPRTGGVASRIPLRTYRAFLEAPVMGDILTRTSAGRSYRVWGDDGPRRVVSRLPAYDDATMRAFFDLFHVRYVIVDSAIDVTLGEEVEAMFGSWIQDRVQFGPMTLLTLVDRDRVALVGLPDA